MIYSKFDYLFEDIQAKGFQGTKDDLIDMYIKAEHREGLDRALEQLQSFKRLYPSNTDLDFIENMIKKCDAKYEDLNVYVKRDGFSVSFYSPRRHYFYNKPFGVTVSVEKDIREPYCRILMGFDGYRKKDLIND